MISRVVDGSSTELRAKKIAADYPEGKFQYIHMAAEKTSITIKQIQSLAGDLATRPRIPRVVWIEEANLATAPAQNALLKILEEPPSETVFVLTCQNAGSLLSTIRSRCALTHLDHSETSGHDDVLALVKRAMAATPGDRITLALELGTDRGELLTWCRNVEQAISEKLKGGGSDSSVKILASVGSLAVDAEGELAANCSVPLVMQHFFLHLPHTK